jgi:hypothetical protein
VKRDNTLLGMLGTTTQGRFNFRTPHDQTCGEQTRATLRLAAKSAHTRTIGLTHHTVVLDDMAFFEEPESVLLAYGPTLASTWKHGGTMIVQSTPHKKDDAFHAAFKRSFSHGTGLSLQIPTWEMNPTIPVDFYKAEYARNPFQFMRDYGATFAERSTAPAF